MEPPAISGRFTLCHSWIAAQRTVRQGGRGRLVEVLAAVRVVGEIIDLFRPPGGREVRKGAQSRLASLFTKCTVCVG